MTTLVVKLVADLLPGDRVFEVIDPPKKMTVVALPWTIEAVESAPSGEVHLRARYYRGRHAYGHDLPGHQRVRVARRRRPKVVAVPERNFQIRNKVTGEVLQAKELTTRGPNGERLYKILWARTKTDRDSWSDPYTDVKFKETLGERWEVLA
jgi:hypothetical protein